MAKMSHYTPLHDLFAPCAGKNLTVMLVAVHAEGRNKRNENIGLIEGNADEAIAPGGQCPWWEMARGSR